MTAAGSGQVGLRAVFALPGYRRLWAARTVSQWGDVANTIALALLVLRLTGSGVGVAGVVGAEIVPVLLLAPLAGVLVDRVPRLRVMIAADLARAVLAGLLPVVSGHIGAVYAIAAGISAGSVFFNPAAGAMLPALVGRDRLIAANSGIWTTAVASQILLAPATGALVTVAGLSVAFWANAASYLASAAFLLGLHRRLPSATAEPRRTAEGVARAGAIPAMRGWWAQALGGVRHVTASRRLRALAAGQALAALSAGATSALLVVLVREHLHAPPAGYGIAIGAIGIGAALGPLLLVRRIRDPARPGWVFGPYALRGGVDLTLATVTGLPAAATALAAYGLATSTGTITFNSLLQASVPDTVRGRVLATFDLTWQLGRLASLAAGGVLADHLGIRAVYYLGGVLLLAAAALAPLARTNTTHPYPGNDQ